MQCIPPSKRDAEARSLVATSKLPLLACGMRGIRGGTSQLLRMVAQMNCGRGNARPSRNAFERPGG